MTPVSPSLQAAVPSLWSQRLVEQLQQLSEVTENLTYRLLELEERLAVGEARLEELREQARGEAELPEAMEGWLEDTDQRLGRVEELLRGGAARGSSAGVAGAGRPLMAVSAPPSRAGQDAAGGDELEEEAIDPFPEEPEQAFLDEQIA